MRADKALAMIGVNVRTFNLEGLWLRDDEFYIDRKRSFGITEGMIPRNLDVSFCTSGMPRSWPWCATCAASSFMRVKGPCLRRSCAQRASS